MDYAEHDGPRAGATGGAFWPSGPHSANGVRYADRKDGQQSVVAQQCELFGFYCQDIYTFTGWPYAADNHYFNPDTGLGLDTNTLASYAAAWRKTRTIGFNLLGTWLSTSKAF